MRRRILLVAAAMCRSRAMCLFRYAACVGRETGVVASRHLDQRTAGLILLAAVTHPWVANPGWYNKVAALPGIGPLFLRTCVFPLGLLLMQGATRNVFEPQSVPADYVRRAAIGLVLRPKTFYSNARDLALLKSFITDQVPRYAELRMPTVIITGDRDKMVSPDINARVLAAALPRAKLVLLKDIGHMPHHAAPDIVATAIDELVLRFNTHRPNRPLCGNSAVAA
jgi:pimeloyl-ACP methyl ester carboxylesterase